MTTDQPTDVPAEGTQPRGTESAGTDSVGTQSHGAQSPETQSVETQSFEAQQSREPTAEPGVPLTYARPADAVDPLGEVVANPDTSYRVKRYIVTALIVGMGFWFGYDGFIAWPKENATVQRLNGELVQAASARDGASSARLSTEIRKYRLHPETDIRLQKILFFTLPPIGLAFLIWSLRASRGQYRMKDDVVSIPGHPPVPISAVRDVNARQWDKKGIAYVSYELADGKRGIFKLDDFIYERKPTDLIYDRIQTFLNPPVTNVDANVDASDETAQEKDG